MVIKKSISFSLTGTSKNIAGTIIYGGQGASLPYTPLQNYDFFVIHASFLRFFLCKSVIFLLFSRKSDKNVSVFDYE